MQKISLGFISTYSPDDPNMISGMPFSCKRQLMGDYHVQNIVPRINSGNNFKYKRLATNILKRLPFNSEHWLKQSKFKVQQLIHHMGNRVISSNDAIREIDLATRLTQDINQQVNQGNFNVLFGCCICYLLYNIQVKIPVVYFTDTTAELITKTYPEYQSKSKAFLNAFDQIERAAMQASSAVVVPSQWAADSVTGHYQIPKHRVHIVPMGANLVPDQLDTITDISAPNRQDLRLCITASDPIRKRVDLAVRTVAKLRELGWSATLTYIGPPTRFASNAEGVTCTGRLKLADKQDREKYWEILKSSHLMILPSGADAFPIAPCEAAHMSLPSIVSDAGGLPEVVRHDLTGLVLPESSTHEEYAQAIQDLVSDHPRYTCMREDAYQDATSRLSWDIWGRTISDIIRQVAEDH